MYFISHTPVTVGRFSFSLELDSVAVGGAVVDIGPYVDYTVYDGILEFVDLPSTGRAVAGQSITLRLLTNTSYPAVTNFGTDGWSVSLAAHGEAATELGLMQPSNQPANPSYWEMTIDGSRLTNVRVL